MRWPILLSLSVLLLVTGCTGGVAREASLQAHNDALKREVEALEAQQEKLKEEVRTLRNQIAESAKQPPETSPPQPVNGTPRYVCAGLATHMYMELSRGKKPFEMLDTTTVQVGFIAKGFPTVKAVPSAEVDFAPVITWVKENPISLVSEVYLPLSQPGYQRVDLRLTNGFYVSVICQQYRIMNFLIVDHAPGST